MAASVMAASVSLKPSPFSVEKAAARGLPSLARASSFRVQASVKKIKTSTPYGMYVCMHSCSQFPHTYIYLIHACIMHALICSENAIICLIIGTGGGMALRDGLDASGRKGKVGIHFY
jgi:hypothetical protein